MLSLKRWEPVAYGDKGIRMKLKRLRRNEAKPIDHALTKIFGGMEKGQGLDKTERAAINLDAMDQIPDEDMRQWFDAYVKDVEGLELEGKPITTGGALFDEAHDTLRLWVLTELSDMSKLSVPEGNASGLPSPSPQGQATASSDSPAPPTAPNGGIAPSDAMETTEAEPSFSPVEA